MRERDGTEKSETIGGRLCHLDARQSKAAGEKIDQRDEKNSLPCHG